MGRLHGGTPWSECPSGMSFALPTGCGWGRPQPTWEPENTLRTPSPARRPIGGRCFPAARPAAPPAVTQAVFLTDRKRFCGHRRIELPCSLPSRPPRYDLVRSHIDVASLFPRPSGLTRHNPYVLSLVRATSHHTTHRRVSRLEPQLHPVTVPVTVPVPESQPNPTIRLLHIWVKGRWARVSRE